MFSMTCANSVLCSRRSIEQIVELSGRAGESIDGKPLSWIDPLALFWRYKSQLPVNSPPSPICSKFLSWKIALIIEIYVIEIYVVNRSKPSCGQGFPVLMYRQTTEFIKHLYYLISNTAVLCL